MPDLRVTKLELNDKASIVSVKRRIMIPESMSKVLLNKLGMVVSGMNK